jgi:hypothetical protein
MYLSEIVSKMEGEWKGSGSLLVAGFGISSVKASGYVG